MKRSINELRFPEASMEVDVAKGRRDWAFSERDKVKHEILFY